MATKRAPIIPATHYHVQCAHDGCSESAVLRKKLPTGWAKLCVTHDTFHARQELKAWRESKGIYSPEKMSEYVKRNAGQMNFTRWAQDIGQHTVDLLMKFGASSQLDKLRLAGAVNDNFRVRVKERVPGEDDA